MKKILLLMVATFLLTNMKAQKYSYLVGASPYQDSLWTFDTSNFAVKSRIGPTLPGFTITGMNGIARRPDSAGTIYIICKLSAVTNRVLCTYNPATGVCTQIGNMGDKFSSITFKDDTTLFGVTGNGATVPETLFKININNGAATLLTPLGNGADGEVICYNPYDNFIYHWSGNSTMVYEKILSTAPYTVTNIPVSGTPGGETFGAVHIRDSVFLRSNISSQIGKVYTNGTFLGLTGGLPDDIRGLAFLKCNRTLTIGATSFCAGDSALLVMNQGNSFQWYKNGVSLLGQNNDSIYIKTEGKYNCISQDFCGADSASVGVTMTKLNLPLVALSSAATSICVGDSLLLTGSSGGTSQWYKNGVLIPSATSNAFYAKTAGIYNMTKANLNGCKDSATIGINVVVNNLPVVSVSGNTSPICFKDSVLLTGSAGGINQWFRNGVLIAGANTNTYYAKVSGKYNMRKTNLNGCSDTASIGVNITVNSLPIVTITNTVSSICIGDSALLTGTSSTSQQWYKNGVLIAGATLNTYFAKTSGVYNLTNTNINGCKDSAIAGVNFVVNNLPVVTLSGGSTPICAGDSTLLTGSSGGTSQWYKNGVLIAGATANTYFAKTSGKYNMIKTNISTCKDSSSAGITVVVNNLPNVTLSGSTAPICLGDSALFTGSAGGTNQWYKNGVLIAGAATNTYFAKTSGVYNMLKTNLNGCKDSAVVGKTLVVNPLPIVSVTSSTDTICVNGGLVALSGTPSGGVFSGLGVSGTNFNPLLGATGNNNVIYTFTNSNACTNKATIVITVELCNGFSNINTLNQIKLYPNPAKDIIWIYNSSIASTPLTMMMTDVFGKTIKVEKVNNGLNALNVSALDNGIYNVVIFGETIRMTTRIVIAK
jgi:Secretion system C-terminal sorting domain